MPKTHVVAEGDTMIKIAHQNGFRDWKVIFFDESNAALRKLRPDPAVLKPGDEVVIPDKKPLEFQVETNRKHTFTVITPKAHFEAVLEDDEGSPYSSKRFKLVVGDKEHEGFTTKAGEVDVPVAPDATEGTLTLWPDDADSTVEVKWTVQLSHHLPVEDGDNKALRARLANLGCDTGPLDQEDEQKLHDALVDFQESHGLEATGTFDPATKALIVELTGH